MKRVLVLMLVAFVFNTTVKAQATPPLSANYHQQVFKKQKFENLNNVALNESVFIKCTFDTIAASSIAHCVFLKCKIGYIDSSVVRNSTFKQNNLTINDSYLYKNSFEVKNLNLKQIFTVPQKTRVTEFKSR